MLPQDENLIAMQFLWRVSFLLFQTSVCQTPASMQYHARTGLTSTFVTASQDMLVLTARKKRVSAGQI